MSYLRHFAPRRSRSARLTAPRHARQVLAAQCLALLLLCLLARPALAGGELVFGMSAAFSGPARGLGMEYHRGILAAFEQVNAQGGAGGWKLRLSLRDDAYDPAAAMRNTISFVEHERVFALLGYVGTPTTARVLPLVNHYRAAGVSLLFPLTGADMLHSPQNAECVCNLRPSYLEETRSLVEALYAAGRRRIAVFHQADVYGRNGWDGVRRALASRGLRMVAEATYKRGAAFDRDFRGEVDIILRGRPDAIVTVGTAPACAAFVRDLRAAGYTDIAAALSFADADNLATFLLAQQRVTGRDALAGLVFSQTVPCYEDTRLPAVRAYRQAMAGLADVRPPQMTPDDYAPHKLSFVGFEGYLAGTALAKAVARMGPVPSRARLREAFASLGAVDLGLEEPADLRPGPGQGLKRTHLTVYRGGRFVGISSIEAGSDWLPRRGQGGPARGPLPASGGDE